MAEEPVKPKRRNGPGPSPLSLFECSSGTMEQEEETVGAGR